MENDTPLAEKIILFGSQTLKSHHGRMDLVSIVSHALLRVILHVSFIVIR